MRYYVTVDGGTENLWLSRRAAKMIREQAIANLRRFRITSGYDYVGLDLDGASVSGFPNLNLAGIERRLRASLDIKAATTLQATRLVVSQAPVSDDTPLDALELVLAVEEGSAFAWTEGRTNFSSVITVDPDARALKVNAVVQDLLQDLMVANSDSIQAVLRKLKPALVAQELDKQPRRKAQSEMAPVDHELLGERLFLGTKASYAAQRARDAGRRSVFSTFEPDRYASFSALARHDLYATMDPDELSGFSDLWTGLLVDRFAEHFLTVDEAVELVRTGSFRRTRQERLEGQGQKVKARTRRQDLAADDLKRVIGDPRIVTADGSYILCVVNRAPTGVAGKLEVEFTNGSPSKRLLNKLTLCTEKRYASMIPLVRKGIVTPIRLFLKRL